MCHNQLCQTCTSCTAETTNLAARDMLPEFFWNSDRDNRENACELCVVRAACGQTEREKCLNFEGGA